MIGNEYRFGVETGPVETGIFVALAGGLIEPGQVAETAVFLLSPAASGITGAVVPVDARGRVHLVRQFRPALGGAITEIPAGLLDPGETPRRAASSS